MDSSDIKFEDAGSCLACVAEAQGSIDAAFALLNDPVVKPEDAVKAAALLQHSLKVVAVAQRLLHDSRLGGVSIGPDVPPPGTPPPPICFAAVACMFQPIFTSSLPHRRFCW